MVRKKKMMCPPPVLTEVVRMYLKKSCAVLCGNGFSLSMKPAEMQHILKHPQT